MATGDEEAGPGPAPAAGPAPPPERGDDRYRLLFDENPLPMWVFDVETHHFLAVNSAAVQHYGWSRSEFLAMRIEDIRPPEDVPILHASLSGPGKGRSRPRVFRHRRRGGDLIDVEVVSHGITWGGRPARLVLANDVTARLRAERALAESEARVRQTQRLEAIGSLAAGVAHDLNNLVTVITSVSDLLLAGPSVTAEQEEDLRQIRAAALRATELTRKLLAFGRKQALLPRRVDLNAVVAEAEALLRRLVRENVELRTSLGAAHATVLADPAQLSEALVNLVVNARDAMPSGGILRLQTAEVELDAERAQRQPGAAPGPYVLLSVSDTGAGMDTQVAARAFEPFFTTKPAGQGTGLGLSLVYGVVRQSGGFVRLASEPGHGTTISVFLPRLEGAPEGPTLAVPGGPPGGTERVLVVEDEPAVRAITCRILEERGYETLSAPNGRAALALVEVGGPAPDLLLSDVVMPEMGGPELARRLAALHPGLKVLFASGYPRGDLGPDMPEEGVSFLPKPFTPDVLARAVRAALDRP